jgi:RNA polymerase sigma-70 factor (ECF subfamily)
MVKPAAPPAPSNLAVEPRPPAPGAMREAQRAPDAERDAERALIERARTGDQAAFRVLVDQHRDRAYGLALRIVRSPADAEEVAQDAFVRAWLALPGYRGEARFATWLHSIVARRAFDRAVVLRGRRQREATIGEATQMRDTGGLAAVEPAALALRMERMLDELTEAQRAVVTLFYYEDRSVEQVAQALGMPGGTVKTHLSRARAALRAAWLRQYGGGSAR